MERERGIEKEERTGVGVRMGKGSHLCLMSPSGSAEMEGTY